MSLSRILRRRSRSSDARRADVGGRRRSGCRRRSAAHGRETGPAASELRSPGPGVVDVGLDRAARAWQRGCSRAPELIVVLMEGRPADVALGECSSCRNVALPQLDPLAPLVLDEPNFRSASCNCRNTWLAVCAISPCIASSFSSLPPKRVRLVPQDPLEQQPIGLQLGGVQERLHSGREMPGSPAA